ncbi:MAG: excinuclease ABC subunit UvrA [Deltaproteobacteria bacterium]|nr:excinuclease ABC subunit UvrA [Deltaproteobacteria bacterium]
MSKTSSRGPRLAAAVEPEAIVVRGAREHNLQIDLLEVPKKKLVVFTGVSGSGKSSLAFDTLYAEGQRRYVESLSAYARQFLGQMDKPKYEAIRGLSPTIAIEQKTASNNPRSTVGTITEINDYLRVLYARAGEQRCHKCGGGVTGRSADEIVDELLRAASAGGPGGAAVTVMAPLAENRKGEFKDVLDGARKAGFRRARIDGIIVKLEDVQELDKKKKHDIDLVIDRVTVKAPLGEARARLTDSVEQALKAGKGVLLGAIERPGDPTPSEERYSEDRACPKCGIGFPELSPQSFSFNSPLGMCVECNGLGTKMEMDPDLVIPNPQLSILEGAIEPWAGAMDRGGGWTYQIVEALGNDFGIDLEKPWRSLPAKDQKTVLFGSDRRLKVKWKGNHGGGSWAMRFDGVIPSLMRKFKETASEPAREKYQRYFRDTDCRACAGERLRPESRAVLVGGASLVTVSRMTVLEAREHFLHLDLTGARATIAAELVKEIDNRLRFLVDVGLDYLSLDRAGPTLSGGESQRIRLASQIGSELSGVLYVLDEPSIGLHQRDNRRLLATLLRLRDLGNSVLVVEHDEETIREADHVVDFGPGAGRLGGKVVFSGAPDELDASAAERSLTAAYISGERRIEVPAERRTPKGWIDVKGARENNLKNVTARFPLGTLTAVTGVSGAGKSSLIGSILYPALLRHLRQEAPRIGKHAGVSGVEQIDKVIDISQEPIGRTPRSNPATYTKAFDHIRELYAMTPEARAYGYGPGRFSFNVKGGRCESCEGDGVKCVEMHFLADVYVPCEVCRGKRYNEATLRVTYKGKNIAELLETSVAEALPLFEHHGQLTNILKTLVEVGLGYIHIGQPATTLSGGEAQRIKLSRELAKRQTGRTLYLLDEPTTGLHFEDVRRLLIVLDKLVAAGNTVLVVEHNLDVIKCADWVIDLGPEGGARGGEVVAAGTPEEVARVKASYTGQFLAPLLPKTRARRLAG